MISQFIAALFSLLFLSILVNAQGKKVDAFELGKDEVTVYFYDPIRSLLSKDPDFENKTVADKSAALDRHLHENPLYLFKLTDKKTNVVRYFCIRGNPKKLNTANFYQVDVIYGVEQTDFDPSVTDYSDKIVQTIDHVDCRGTMFESMDLFDDAKNKKLVGAGIEVYGYFRRIQPYDEIRSSMIRLINGLK